MLICKLVYKFTSLQLFFVKKKSEKETQNNALYNDKTLFCANLTIGETNNQENKKVTKVTKRCTFPIDLPNEEFKIFLQFLAKKKRITQKKLTEEIFYNYAIEELKKETKYKNELQDILSLLDSEFNQFGDNRLEEDQNQFKIIMVKMYNVFCRNGRSNDLKQFKSLLIKMTKELENRDTIYK